MDRRHFLKGAVGSAALGAVSVPAFGGLAPRLHPESGAAVVVAQSDLPAAFALGETIAGQLHAGGLAVRRIDLDRVRLGRYAEIVALLDRSSRVPLIGVMDDASALIFQQIAASRGRGERMRVSHRVAAAGVRHCCTVAGTNATSTWADRHVDSAQRIAQLYVQAVGHGRAASAPAGDGRPFHARSASFVSFALSA